MRKDMTGWQGFKERMRIWWFFKIVHVSERHLKVLLEELICDKAGEWHAGVETQNNRHKGEHFIRVPIDKIPFGADWNWTHIIRNGVPWGLFYGRNHLSALLKCYAALIDG